MQGLELGPSSVTVILHERVGLEVTVFESRQRNFPCWSYRDNVIVGNWGREMDHDDNYNITVCSVVVAPKRNKNIDILLPSFSWLRPQMLTYPSTVVVE
jgi:hypothetical protein